MSIMALIGPVIVLVAWGIRILITVLLIRALLKYLNERKTTPEQETIRRSLGEALKEYRQRCGMTQAEVAEAAGLADRTYADIERGSVNMRIETILRICSVLHITPNEILTDEQPSNALRQELLWERLNACNPKDKNTALQLLEVYLTSLN